MPFKPLFFPHTPGQASLHADPSVIYLPTGGHHNRGGIPADNYVSISPTCLYVVILLFVMKKLFNQSLVLLQE